MCAILVCDLSSLPPSFLTRPCLPVVSYPGSPAPLAPCLQLCDYGVSVNLTEERAVTRTGSREYMAPEVHVCPLKRGPEDGKDNPQLAYGCSVDVWSLGAMMYELLVGFTPFPGGPPPTVTPAGSLPPNKTLAFPCSVSGPARDFVEQCLALHPGDRPTVKQLLAHPWVQAALVRTWDEGRGSGKLACS